MILSFLGNVFMSRKEVNNMVAVYVALIIKGKRTFSSIPETLKEQVKEMLIDLELEELLNA